MNLIALFFTWNYGETRIEKYLIEEVVSYGTEAKVYMNLISDSPSAPANLIVRVGPLQSVDMMNNVGKSRWVKIRRGFFGWNVEEFR